MNDTFTIALLADTHGEVDARILAAIACCRYVVHAGDIGSGAVLAALGNERVTAVRGNNDVPHKWPSNDLLRLQQLSDEVQLSLPGGPLVVVHGHSAGRAAGRHEWLRRCYPTARLIVYGHSHRLTLDQQSLPWVVNPGAAGRERTFGGPSCLLLHLNGSAWRLETVRFPLR